MPINLSVKTLLSISPTEKQNAFIESESKFCAFVGGVRSGKTTAGTLKAINCACDMEHSMCKVGAVIAPTMQMMNDVCLPIWRNFLPRRMVRQFKASQSKLLLANGNTVLFRSAENPERLSGLTLDWFHIDEAAMMQKSVWDILHSRIISTRGRGFITTTPRGRNWVFDLCRSDEFFTVSARTVENPFVDMREIELARKMLDDKFFRQQYEASFIENAPLVFSEFGDENIGNFAFDGKLRTFVGADFGWTHPSALVWVQMRTDGQLFVISELVESHMKPAQLAMALSGEALVLPSGKIFRAPCALSQVEAIVCGVEARQSRQEAGGMAMAQILFELGVKNLQIVAPQIPKSISMVCAAIKNADSERKLRISNTCARLLDDIRNYVFASESDMPLKDNVHDHSIDALRYVLFYIVQVSAKWHF